MAENVTGAEKPQNGGRNNNRNHRKKRYNGAKNGGNNNNRAGGAENKQQGKRENGEGRQNKKPRDGYQRRDRNRGPKQPRENQGQFQDSPKPSMPVKKREETVEDIRSENARITKEIYLDIAAMKNISLD